MKAHVCMHIKIYTFRYKASVHIYTCTHYAHLNVHIHLWFWTLAPFYPDILGLVFLVYYTLNSGFLS